MGAQKTINVLLTGFEPFGEPRPVDNRSWETIKQLADEKISMDDGAIVLECHCHRMPVSYSPLSEMLPKFHLERDYGIVIHCGATHKDLVGFEKLAHKKGYFKAGNGGPDDVPPGNMIIGKYDTADVLATSIDVDGLYNWMKSDRGWEHVETSTDAGRYTCEYTYYTSLAEGKTTYAKRQLPEPKVLFVHVPQTVGKPYNDSEYADIVRDVLRFLAKDI